MLIEATLQIDGGYYLLIERFCCSDSNPSHPQ